MAWRKSVHFAPTDEELVCYYLARKIMGKELPPDVVKECDLYGDAPWNIFDGSLDDGKCYVFTRVNRKNSRVVRVAGDGTWTGEQREVLKDVQGNVIAMKRYFTFHVKSPSGTQGESTRKDQWNMYEYSLSPEDVSY